MKIDAYLLNHHQYFLRFYEWSRKSLSLGRFQPLKQINTEYCFHHGIDIVRRITGGKTVLHDQELTYSIGCDSDYFSDNLLDSYKIISHALLHGLNHLGIHATLACRQNRPGHSPICFQTSSAYEIVVDQKKIIGSAQRRIKNRMLQHGSVLIHFNESELAACFNGDYNINNVTSISKELNNSISIAAVKQAMKKGFEQIIRIS